MSDYVTHRDLVDPYGDWRRGEPVATCEYCGEGIYKDEYYYKLDEFECVHESCFSDYMEDKHESDLVYPE